MPSNLVVRCLSSLAALWVCLTVTPWAQAQSAANAQVVGANVNCRTHPPQFAAATLFTQQVPAGDLVAVVPVNTRVTALSRMVIADRDDWVRIRIPSGAECWIYTGPHGHLRFLQMDPGRELVALSSGAEGSGPERAADGLRGWLADWLPLAAAEAQALPLAAPSAVPTAVPTAVEPTVRADPVKTLAFGAAMALILLATFIALSRFAFPGSPSHAVVAGLLIATSMGAVSQTLLPEVLVQLATQWVLPEAALASPASAAARQTQTVSLRPSPPVKA